MKVAQDNSPALISNANGQVVDIQIGSSREAQVMIMNVLTNTLYTNKPEAVWREYGCNAADANVEAGRADIPIEITLPTRLSAEAVIRDFGYGMTESRMLDVYCKLGESTKRGSNDETGMIGIGAKAGYAYGDMFTVTSFNGGIKTVYQFFKDQGVPRMMKVSQDASDAPEGTEIRVPVRAADLEAFRIAAEKTFRYFRVPPIVHGGALEYQRGHSVFKGSDWTLTGDQKPVAIMGNVGYEIDGESLDLPYDCLTNKLLDIGVEIHFAIGDLEIAANRESLQYKDGTKKAIETKAKRIVSDLAVIFKQQIANAPNLWEAKKAYADAFEKIGSSEKQTLRSLLDGHVTWNGEKMQNGYFNLVIDKADATLATLNSYTRNWRGRVSNDRTCDFVIPNPQLTIALNDLPKLNVPQSRVRGHFAKNVGAHQLVVLTFKCAKAKANFWKQNRMDGVPTIPLSSLPPLLTANGTSYAPSAHRTKHSARAFVLDETSTLTKYSCKTRSAWWTVEDVDKDKGKGVYVVVKGFKVEPPVSGDLIEPDDLIDDVKLLRSRSLIAGKMYAFKRNKEGKLPKLGKGWVTLKEHIAETVKDWSEKHAQKIADYEETMRVSALLPCKVATMIPDCIAKECIEARERMHTDAKSHSTLADFIRDGECSEWVSRKLLVLPDATVDLEDLQKQVVERYPMLAYYASRGQTGAKKSLTNLSEYIKLVETGK